MNDNLLDTWNIHARIALYVLDAISTEALNATPSFKSRTAGQMFAHVHNNRRAWVEAAASDLVDALSKLDTHADVDKATVRGALEASAGAVADLLRRGLEKGRISGFKPHPEAFLGYLISHEAYHYGEIGIVLAQAGYRLDKEVAYGMWDWHER